MLARVLAWADDDPLSVRPEPLRAAHVGILLTVTLEIVVFVAFRKIEGVVDAAGTFERLPTKPLDFLLPLVLATCLVPIALGIRRQLFGAGAALGMAAVTLLYLPNTPNHFPAITLALGFLALTDLDDAEERRLCLQGLRWLLVIVLVGSGVQKIVYGHYDRGEFLAYMVATDPYFAKPFAWIAPTFEIERLAALGPVVEGAGPYAFTWWPLVVVSNLVIVLELAAPILLLWRRTRALGVVVTILMMVAIELGPRELFFGAVAVQLALLYTRRDWNSRVLPFVALAGVLLVLSKAGVLPAFVFS